MHRLSLIKKPHIQYLLKSFFLNPLFLQNLQLFIQEPQIHPTLHNNIKQILALPLLNKTHMGLLPLHNSKNLDTILQIFGNFLKQINIILKHRNLLFYLLYLGFQILKWLSNLPI